MARANKSESGDSTPSRGVPLTEDDECPSCGRQTLTERGITISHNDGTTGGATWLNCINCDWDAKGGNDVN